MTTVHDIRPTLSYDKETDTYTSPISYQPETRHYTQHSNTVLSIPNELFHQAIDTYMLVYGCEWSTAFTAASSVSSWGVYVITR